MSDLIGKLQSRIIALRAELAELETAQRVYLRLSGDEPQPAGSDDLSDYFPNLVTAPVNGEAKKDLRGKTVREAAQIILSESSIPMHFKDVYKQAMARGYTSGRDKGGAASSFWSLMKRRPEYFKPVGGGRFTLPD